MSVLSCRRISLTWTSANTGFPCLHTARFTGLFWEATIHPSLFPRSRERWLEYTHQRQNQKAKGLTVSVECYIVGESLKRFTEMYLKLQTRQKLCDIAKACSSVWKYFGTWGCYQETLTGTTFCRPPRRCYMTHPRSRIRASTGTRGQRLPLWVAVESYGHCPRSS